MSSKVLKTLTGMATAISLLALAACSGGDGGSTGNNEGNGSQDRVSAEELESALSTNTTLTFWTWVPGIEAEVARFTDKYPAIKVDIVNVGQGLPHFTKLRTALGAGSGAPDLAQMTYDYIPTFTVTNSLLDISPYVSEDFESKFVDWTVQQVSGANGEIFAVPQDTGPMGMLYRTDILEEHGIEVPTTWEEFAQAARDLNAKDPNVYLTNFAANSNDAWSAFSWQMGDAPYDVSSAESLTVNVNSDAAGDLAAYWEPLFKEGVVSTDPDFTDEWYQAINDGKYASWLVPAWGPLFLEQSAAATSGKWRAAPLPVWEEGKAVSGNWGGSTTAVIEGTDHAIAAAALAEFLNSDPDTVMELATKRSLFPASLATLQDPTFLAVESPFYGGQKVNELFAEISSTVNSGFDFAPFRDMDITIWRETVGTAIANKTDLAPALEAWEEQVTTFATEQGFTVN